MFYGLENTQLEIAEQLKTLLEQKNFPSSVLFYGPSGSSRMFAALAVAKAFGSDIDSTIILSDRKYSVRIAAAVKLFRKSKNTASKKFLKQEVETFLKQFHGALLDSSSSSNKKKFSQAGECMDLLQGIEEINESDCESYADKLEKTLAPILESIKTASVSINQIRDIKQWAGESSIDGKTKIVIIENLENATDSASNALLKILEEPPADTFFILISQNIGRIPATILSRVRKFRFNELSSKEKSFVFQTWFVNPNDYENIESFFLEYSGINIRFLKGQAENLVNNEKTDIPGLVRELEKSQAWDCFFEFVIKALENSYINGKIKSKYCNYLINEIENVISKGKAFYQNKRLTFDFIVYRTKEVLS